MLNQALITSPAAPFQMADTVAEALDLLDGLKLSHWPVVEESLFRGLLSEEVLLDANAHAPVSELVHEFLPFSVMAHDHFLSAVRLSTDRKIDVVPVTNAQQEYAGVIVEADLLRQLAMHIGTAVPGALLVLEMAPQDFSPGEIARLIETNNAQLRQLNTRFDEETGVFMVTIRINRQEVSDIIATFQRYDYRVVFFAGEEQYENELRRNYHHLLHFLEM